MIIQLLIWLVLTVIIFTIAEVALRFYGTSPVPAFLPAVIRAVATIVSLLLLLYVITGHNISPFA